MPRLGLCISPFMGLSLTRIGEFAREAEDAGIEGLFIPEGRNDGLLCCYAAMRATQRLIVATWIANIFLRDPALCAWTAQEIAEEAPGRFILGLGVSHRPLLENLGINIANPRERLREYTRQLRTILKNDSSNSAVPIHFAALALETVRLGAELADGLMLDICTVDRLWIAAATARETLAKCNRSSTEFTITTGVPLFLHTDRRRALDAARSTLLFYARLPAYNRMFARSGFLSEMAQVPTIKDSIDAAAALAARNSAPAASMITSEMVESVALIGPPAEWPARFDALAAAGAEWIIVRPFPVADDYETSLHAAIKAVAPRA